MSTASERAPRRLRIEPAAVTADGTTLQPSLELPVERERARPAPHPGAARLLNRELSWLDFNSRVLALAEDENVPLLERARFLAIASRGLDEFFQVRVGGLKQQVAAGFEGASGDPSSPRAQVQAIRPKVERLYERQGRVFLDSLGPELDRHAIRFCDWEALDDADRAFLDTEFEDRIYPVLTPLAVDPGHPFPYVSSLSLNLMVVIAEPATHQERIARIKVPPLLSRFVVLPDGERFVPVEQVIAAHLGHLFEGMKVVTHHVFRLTRNADYQLDSDDEADDLVEAVRAVLQQRRRSPLVVRMEVGADMPPTLVDLLMREVDIEARDVYRVAGPLDLGGLFEVCKLDRPELKYRPWSAVTPAKAASAVGAAEADIFRNLRQEHIFVHHPYDSFENTVEAFIERAAEDPRVLAIKQTLYRTSGPVSPIIRSLTRAAEAGKQVVALVELTARFDEQNNINWAEVLEDAGVHVVYGTVGLKTHAKVTLVVREEQGGIRRYCHVGTGNYNHDTARIYEDLGLLSSDSALGADVGELFNSLTGYSRRTRYRKLLVAPASMRPALLSLIERETAKGAEGRIIIKVNNLVDPEIIEALYAASRAGVDIDLIVRSICCLLPGVPGQSDNIRVRSLVGRYLEHSRILRFGRDPKDADYYISSADLMPRNLDRRVEVALPIRSADLRARLEEILGINLSDDVLAWSMTPDGTWEKVPTVTGVDTQVRLQELALARFEAEG
ncbi:MAG: polyphosphate kinase 1 [Candidatus Dormibacteria bacterium]|jgi:polyphosphate kinase